MNNKWKQIEEELKNLPLTTNDFSKEELIQRISIYHEELILQNDELKQINADLEKVNSDFRELFESTPIAYVIIDNNGIIKQANTTAILQCGDIVNQPISHYINDAHKDKLYSFLKILFSKKQNRATVAFFNKEKNRHFDLIGKEIASKPNTFLIGCIDFEKHHKTKERISDLSYKDQLTGLYNRHYFQKILDTMNKEDVLPLSIITADANGLKILNDTFGHYRGDELLQKVAKIASSISVPNHTVYRIGGDEFLILLPKTTIEECSIELDKLYKQCSALKINDIQFSVSWGMATMELMEENIDEIIKKAEKNMYEQKIKNETSTNAEIVHSLTELLYKKFPNEKYNSEKVSEYMGLMAKQLDYNENHTELMKLSGLMHNIGKVSNHNDTIDNSIITGSNTIANIKKYSKTAYQILKSSSSYSKIAHIVLYQYERVDGTGYPRGLKGKEIPDESKILSVCRAFNAMTTEQAHRTAMTTDDAIAELEANINTQFDENVVKTFIEMIRKKP